MHRYSPRVWVCGVLTASLLAGCGGGALAPSPSVNPPGSPQLLIYAGHAPQQVPGGAGSSAVSLTLSNNPVPGVGDPLPSGAQYLVYEPGYSGTYAITSSCNPAAVAKTSFETEITPQNPGYSFKPSTTGNGPGAILDVSSSGIFGPQTCTFTVSDTAGRSAAITVTDKQLLLYPGVTAGVPPAGAAGTGFYLDATFTPGNVVVYEHGYSGGYELAPSTCSAFSAVLHAPVDPGSGAVLTLSANGAPTPEVCTFTVFDSAGNQAFVQTAYEGV